MNHEWLGSDPVPTEDKPLFTSVLTKVSGELQSLKRPVVNITVNEIDI